MTLKYIGMFLVFITCLFVGNGLALSEKKKISCTEELRELILHIEREITCFKTPLPKIYSSFVSENLQKNGFCESLVKTSLADALEKHKNLFAVSPQTCSALEAFADFLGKSDKDDQSTRCKYVVSRLDDDLRKKREEYPKNKKMYVSLSFLIAVVTVILLL